MAEPGTGPAGESMAAHATTTTVPIQETTTSTLTVTTGTTFTTTTATATTASSSTSTTTTATTTTTSTTATTLKPPVPQKAEAKVYTVCAASYRKEQPAKDHAAKLVQKGLEAKVAEVNLKGKGRWFRVCVGEFASANKALAQSRAWRQEGLIADPFVARMR